MALTLSFMSLTVSFIRKLTALWNFAIPDSIDTLPPIVSGFRYQMIVRAEVHGFVK